jgi:hypothetical protein
MFLAIFRNSPLARNGFLAVLFLMVAGMDAATAGLSEQERITLDQPACAQMKSYSQDITLLNDELQNVRKFGQRGRLCDVLGRTTTAISNTIGYMQSHIGECTITHASTEQMASLGKDLETDRRKLCR